MKVSIVTACYNAAKTLPQTLESVRSQTMPEGVEIEHIVVDGGSKDGTVKLLQSFRPSPSPTATPTATSYTYTFRWLSEKDRGLYDAINKGIRMATGDVIGILNADDWFDGDDVIASVVREFWMGVEKVEGVERVEKVAGVEKVERVEKVEGVEKVVKVERVERDSRVEMERCRENGEKVEKVDCVYGDIRFVKVEGEFDVRGLRFDVRGSGAEGQGADVGCPSSFVGRREAARTVRYYSAKRWKPWMFQWGKMPPHPGVYIRRECFEKFGDYKLGYKIAADYELLVRFLRKHAIRAKYLDKCLVCMTLGGLSTKNWKSNLLLNQEIVRGNRENGYFCCLPMLLPKYAFKIWEVILPRIGVGRV